MTPRERLWFDVLRPITMLIGGEVSFSKRHELAVAIVDTINDTSECEHCDECGRAYCDVYVLPDAVWERIHERAPGGLLCPTCALDRVVMLLGHALSVEE